jgi:hypothetical protein
MGLLLDALAENRIRRTLADKADTLAKLLEKGGLNRRDNISPAEMSDMELINFTSQILATVALFKVSDEAFKVAKEIERLLKEMNVFLVLIRCPSCGGIFFCERKTVGFSFYRPEPHGIEEHETGNVKIACKKCGHTIITLDLVQRWKTQIEKVGNTKALILIANTNSSQ